LEIASEAVLNSFELNLFYLTNYVVSSVMVGLSHESATLYISTSHALFDSSIHYCFTAMCTISPVCYAAIACKFQCWLM